MSATGYVAPGWEAVGEAFQHNLDAGEEIGAGVAVYHRGERVVDLTGGSFDETGGRPYDADTLQLVFSTTKGITAIALAMCVQRGLLRYDDRVAEHWPEFAVEGKGEATVAQLASHRCGLICPDGPLAFADVLDWKSITSRLAATKPDWPIGSGHGYHALTYGWLVGEVIRRVDGRDIGTFVQEEIAGPLGVDVWIGLPEEQECRVAPLATWAPPTDPAIKAMIDAFIGPGTRAGRALTLGGVMGDHTFNSREVHAAQMPAANAITNADALARIYASTIGEVEGVRLLDDATREAASTSETPAGESDLCLVVPTVFAKGFALPDPFSPFAGPGSYGHTGAGGSVAFAQPSRQLGFGYVMNKMNANLAADQRPQRLIDAAVMTIDAA